MAHNLFYYVNGADADDYGIVPWICISNPDAVDSPRPAEFMEIEGPSVHGPRTAPTHLLYGDGDFVLVVDTIGLEVWCFDETVRPPGAVLLPRDKCNNEERINEAGE